MTDKCKKCFKVLTLPTCASTSLLLLRLVVGAAMMMHGWGKIQNPFAWMPEGAPLAIPGIFQALAALAEFGGGLAWVLGFLMPLASVGIACTMAVAVYTHAVVFGDSFVASQAGQGSYELALVYLVTALMFLNVGPGKYSVDTKVFKTRAD